ncbi:unnamed protein product, partial [Closterium sp. Naga37s-1]
AHGMWVHVDAAYAGMACMCAEMRHHLAGVHLADSLASNAHKWLLTSFDCCCMWTQESENHHVVDYKDWEIPIGRRFRSLKLWMVLCTYRAEGIRAYIRRHVALAELFEKAVLQDDRFQVSCTAQCITCATLSHTHSHPLMYPLTYPLVKLL